MNVDLLRKLLPGEVSEYLVRNEVRADGRELRDHRPFTISRGVMGDTRANLAGGDPVKVSCAVRLGQTHVLSSLVLRRQDCTVLQSRPLVKLSLTLVKDQSLNVRRDTVEEKEHLIKASLKNKIEQCLPEGTAIAGREHTQLDFAFSVVSDDGNLPSVLVAAASDLLRQIDCERAMWATLLLLHEGAPAEEASAEPSKSLLVDPTSQECQNLSSSLLLVTLVGPAAQGMAVDEGEEEESDGHGGLIVEAVPDALRSSFSCQLSDNLNFKPSAKTFAQLREATLLGKAYCVRALEQVERQQGTPGEAKAISVAP